MGSRFRSESPLNSKNHPNSSNKNSNPSEASTSRPSTSRSAANNDEYAIVVANEFEAGEQFLNVLDRLDAKVEKFRRDAMILQEQRDYLLMSIDLVKSDDMNQNLSASEKQEAASYIQRINERLLTVDIKVLTVRNNSQQESLSNINQLIDQMITMEDPEMSRHKCQEFLNACCSANATADFVENDAGPVDKKFENTLLGCTLDDQKNIKKRLQALMDYLLKQTVHK